MRLARKARGFTLLELLVVIVIIGVIVSAATLSFSVLGRDRESEEQTRRFWAILQQAREEAELQSLDLGVFVVAGGYQYLRYDARHRRWAPLADDRMYEVRKLPEGLRFRVWLDGREVVLRPDFPDRKEKESEKDAKDDADEGLRDDHDKDDEADKWPPQIMVLSSGEVMPFELHIERDGAPAEWRAVGLADNDLRVERRANTGNEWILMAQTKPPPVDDKQRVSDARR
jgi:general secretion pathway protein H